MIKKLLSLVTALTLMLSLSGCGFSDKLYGKEDMRNIFVSAAVSGNVEYMSELIDDGKITQRMLNGALYDVGVGNYETGLFLLEKGADPNYEDMPQIDAYNNRIMHLILLLTSDKIDVDQKDSLGNSVLYQAMMNNSTGNNEFYSYTTCERLLEKGAKIEERCFKNNDDPEQHGYMQMHDNPMTVQMLIKKYLADGGKLSIPDPLKYAFCGEIDKCIEAIEGSSSDLTPEDRRIISCFASAFGNVEQYERVCELLSTDSRFHEMILAGCGNFEMLKYSLEKDDVDLKIDPEKMIDDLDYSTHNQQYVECINTAASWGNYDMCKYLMDEGIYPDLALNTLPPLYHSLDSGNFKVFKEIYNYIKTNYQEISEEQLRGVFNDYGKGEGLCHGMSDFDKQVLDFLLEQGHTFEQVRFTDMPKESVNYLIENGVEVTDEHFMELVKQNNKEGLESAFKNGYKITDEAKILERAVECSSHDIVKLIIDNGVKLPDNIMETARLGSKATAKVLIDAGAKTDLKYDHLDPPNGGGLIKEGDFDLADYYEHYSREDLAELVD